MRDYVDVTGKNEDEAISKALAQLGLERDDVSVEVLERAKSGFLGFGSCPAKVRVYYGPETEAEPAPKAGPAASARQAASAQQAASARQAEPAPRKESVRQTEDARRTDSASRTEPVRKAESDAVGRAAPEGASERRPELRQERSRPRRSPDAKDGGPRAEVPPAPVQALGEEADDEKAQAIRKFLSGLLEQMDTQAEIKVYLPEKGRYKVILEGQGLGSLIGRRGETLDAIQQLTSYAVNRSGVRVRVQLDAENYRAKREQSLQHLARKVAAKVVRYRRSVTLEPMNAYERHVIHTALQDFEGVTTHSTGVDPNRRVVVSLEREKK